MLSSLSTLLDAIDASDAIRYSYTLSLDACRRCTSLSSGLIYFNPNPKLLYRFAAVSLLPLTLVAIDATGSPEPGPLQIQCWSTRYYRLGLYRSFTIDG